jgi:type IV pilus biogenesis protein CpaD/CtpE
MMERSARRVLSGILAAAGLLVGVAGCTADRSGVQIAPTAARPCPPWVEFPADTHDNGDSAYLGCVNAVNLKNMVDDPNDLGRGRALGPASGEREILGMDAYSQGKNKAAKGAGAAAPAIVIPPPAEGATQ